MDVMADTLQDAPEVFSLTSLIDSSAALQASKRLYQASHKGLRFFSELNRAVPNTRARALVEELERAAESEFIADPV